MKVKHRGKIFGAERIRLVEVEKQDMASLTPGHIVHVVSGRAVQRLQPHRKCSEHTSTPTKNVGVLGVIFP